jgi:two-component system chemotaxis response regulator CheB
MHVKKLLLIGASTGGPGHLFKIVPHLGTEAAVVIAQHMQESFIHSFCQQLEVRNPLDVHKAQPDLPLRAGQITVVHGDLTALHFSKGELTLTPHPKHSIYQPSVDILFETASLLADRIDIMAILLTGIGSDGAEGMLRLHRAGALTIAEARESAIVYGMPKAAKELGASQEVLHLEEITERIQRFSHDV